MATAKVTKFYKSTKWVDLEYVVLDNTGKLEKGKLHLDSMFYRTDCTPEAFAPSKRKTSRHDGVHCGWAMYREGAADIGEDFYKLLDTVDATQETQP